MALHACQTDPHHRLCAMAALVCFQGVNKWNARRSSTFGGSTIHRLHVLKLVAARHAEVNLSAAGGAVGAVKAGI